MDTTQKKGTPVAGMSEKEHEIMEAREIADSEITEPAFISPVQKHKGYTATVLAVLGLCAAFLLADLFYYNFRRDDKNDNATYTSSVMQQQNTGKQPTVLPGLTVVAHNTK